MDNKPRDGREPRALDSALEQIRRSVCEGARHGFFELTVRCQIENNGRRSIVVEYGKLFRFVVPAAEVE